MEIKNLILQRTDSFKLTKTTTVSTFTEMQKKETTLLTNDRLKDLFIKPKQETNANLIYDIEVSSTHKMNMFTVGPEIYKNFSNIDMNMFTVGPEVDNNFSNNEMNIFPTGPKIDNNFSINEMNMVTNGPEMDNNFSTNDMNMFTKGPEMDNNFSINDMNMFTVGPKIDENFTSQEFLLESWIPSVATQQKMSQLYYTSLGISASGLVLNTLSKAIFERMPLTTTNKYMSITLTVDLLKLTSTTVVQSLFNYQSREMMVLITDQNKGGVKVKIYDTLASIYFAVLPVGSVIEMGMCLERTMTIARHYKRPGTMSSIFARPRPFSIGVSIIGVAFFSLRTAAAFMDQPIFNKRATPK